MTTSKLDTRRNLQEFLDRRGCTYADLLDQVSSVFGAPHLVTAAGSIPQRFGNSSSDLDLIVCVGSSDVTDFPVPSHALGFAVDTNFVDTAAVRDAIRWIRAGCDPADFHANRDAWKNAYRRLFRIGRLVTGVPIVDAGTLRQELIDLRPAFTEFCIDWWVLEGLRHRTSARMLADSGRFSLAAQRYCDAGLALLDAHVADEGEIYVGPKWIGAKLERVGSEAMSAAFWQLLGIAGRIHQDAGGPASGESIVASLSTGFALSEDPEIAVTLAPEVERARAHDRTLYYLPDGRGLEVTASDSGEPGCDGATWFGRASAIPDTLRDLLMADLAWLAPMKGRMRDEP